MLTATSRDVHGTTALVSRASQIDFGLVVGVDHYPRFRSLQGAVADARRFHAWLCEPDGGGVAPEHAQLVVSRREPVAPLQDEVDEQLLEIVTTAERLGGARRLYFHFSGHGASSSDESTEDVALLLAKWSRSLARLALSSNQYRGALGGMGLFEEIVVFLDCCRTTAEHTIGMPPTITFRPQSQRCATRTFIAYATEPGRSAFEVPDAALWQGVFTRKLLAILRRSSRGITAANLKRALEYEIASTGQRAHVINGLLDDSTFGRRGVWPTLIIRFMKARGRVRLHDGNRAVIAEREVGDQPWKLQLPAGLYKLEDEAGTKRTFEHGGQESTYVAL